MKIWKLSWDILAVLLGLVFFWKIFNYSGDHIPAFGYFPIGIVLGLMGFGFGVVFAHLFEGIFGLIIYRLFGIRTDKKLLLE